MSDIELRELTSHDQFEDYYKRKGLETVQDKIAHLKEITGVLAIRSSYVHSAEGLLACLENSVLFGSW